MPRENVVDELAHARHVLRRYNIAIRRMYRQYEQLRRQVNPFLLNRPIRANSHPRIRENYRDYRRLVALVNRMNTMDSRRNDQITEVRRLERGVNFSNIYHLFRSIPPHDMNDALNLLDNPLNEANEVVIALRQYHNTRR